MKGPGYRYDLDIRRVWECPACKQRLRHLGDVTSRRCHCDSEGHWMRIVNENPRRTFPAREKIVIPDDEPEEVSVEPSDVVSVLIEEVTETVTITEVSEPVPELEPEPAVSESPVPETSAAPSPELPQTSEEQTPGRKKRRKKRRRKKSRKNQPEMSGEQESSPDSSPPPPRSDDSSQSRSDGEDFGTNVF